MSDSPYIFEVNQENFAQIVIDGSLSKPVLVDFWADWCAPCRSLMPVLAKLAEAYQGQFILAKVNSDENQALAQQFGVRSLPTVKLFKQGAPVDEFMGALPEGQVREFLEKHIERESDKLHQAALQTLQMGDIDNGLKQLVKALELAPGDAKITADLASVMMQQGENDQAEALLKQLPAEVQQDAAVAGMLAKLEISRQASDVTDLDALQQKANDGDLAARYQLATVKLANNDYASAMDDLLIIMQRDREFKDDIGRKTLLKVFDMLGEHPLVDQYRRKMFNYLY